MHHAVLIHDNGKGSTPTAEVFTKRQDARAAFRKVKTGLVALYELSRSQAVKRANHTIRHEDSPDSLDKMSEKELRAEAKSRDLLIAGNPTASESQLRSEIQQDELTRRLQHRAPLESFGAPAAPVAIETDGVIGSADVPPVQHEHKSRKRASA